MQIRERGAAHINIFFFLVMLVLFLGALGFGYVQLSENNQLVEDAKTARAEADDYKSRLLIREHYIEAISGQIGSTGTYSGKEGFSYDPKPSDLENVALPSKVKEVVETFADQTGVPKSLSEGLSSFLGQVKVVLDAREKRASDLALQSQKADGAKVAAESAVSEANRQKQTEVAALNMKQSELRNQFQQTWSSKDNQIFGLREEVKKRREEIDSVREESAQSLLKERKEKNLLTARIGAAASLTKLVNPPQEPDGQVISSSEAANRAWINLGRKDLLPRGTTFQVLDPDKPGIKAYGTVIQVERDRAEIRVSGLRDKFEPVVKGDLVRNDLYSPHVKRNIYLLGRFSHPLTKPTIATILKSLGNKVHERIGPGVDLVIVGGDTVNEAGDGFTSVTQSEDYKQALFLSIEIATLNKLRDFLKLSD